MSDVKFKFNRVMVIDDNPIDIYIARKIMANHNFSENVLTFDGARTAMEFLVQRQNELADLPEVIIVDIYMPVMSGFDFLEAYDKLSPDLKNHCRVYVVSSSIDEFDIRRVNENKNVAGFGLKTLNRDFLDTITI